MNIYIEHNGEFYDYSGYEFDRVMQSTIVLKNNNLKITDSMLTDKRNFEIGARVYFENVGWTEVVETTRETRHCFNMCAMADQFCASKRILCGIGWIRSDGKVIYFKKLNLTEKREEPKQADQFYVLNTKTGVTHFIHESEESARTEAERLASKQPGDVFRVLKVVGECIGKVNVEWK